MIKNPFCTAILCDLNPNTLSHLVNYGWVDLECTTVRFFFQLQTKGKQPHCIVSSAAERVSEPHQGEFQHRGLPWKLIFLKEKFKLFTSSLKKKNLLIAILI